MTQMMCSQSYTILGQAICLERCVQLSDYVESIIEAIQASMLAKNLLKLGIRWMKQTY
jgi:hypothetical protein